jgi:Ca2+-binding RTX toxin-like protein
MAVCDGQRPTIVGTAGPDSLVGTPGDDVIVGLGGDDQIDAGAGNDLVCPGLGDDLVLGGTGNDTLAESAEDGIYDNLTYDARNGRVESNYGAQTAASVIAGFETYIGSPANDMLVSSAGADTFDGRDGVDDARYTHATMPMKIDLGAGTASGDGKDRLISVEDAEGGSADDVIVGSSAGNLVYGNGGNDRISLLGGADGAHGMAGDDVIDAGPGNDRIDGHEGNDTLLGGDGDDMIVPDNTDGDDDVVDGGAGRDLVSYLLSSVGRRIDLTAQVVTGGGTDRLTSIEDAQGGSGGDTLVGSAGVNALSGGDGNDRIAGLAADDALFGDGGSDTCIGGGDPGDTFQSCEAITP